MYTPFGHLVFCTNIFPGETWREHFTAIKKNIPPIKKQLLPDGKFGIGLRLSNTASKKLLEKGIMEKFKQWLQEQNCYVLSINGFPYGNFHKSHLKDAVHLPDWTTTERLQYTLRLFGILADLLEGNMEGGVSTSPLSYRHWFNSGELAKILEKATYNIVEAICVLVHIFEETGKILHLDIEPEAGGIIESMDEFLKWYQQFLIPIGVPVLEKKLNIPFSRAKDSIFQHVRLCYDVCHFSVGFETPKMVLVKLKQTGIKVGRFQLSSALKVSLPNEVSKKNEIIGELMKFSEPVYLHQVVTQKRDGSLVRYADLPEVLKEEEAKGAKEWRSHFHVPLFMDNYGLLSSTQDDVREALALQKKDHFCEILEVETYTWGVLPLNFKLPLKESIIREMQWVVNFLRTLKD